MIGVRELIEQADREIYARLMLEAGKTRTQQARELLARLSSRRFHDAEFAALCKVVEQLAIEVDSLHAQARRQWLVGVLEQCSIFCKSSGPGRPRRPCIQMRTSNAELVERLRSMAGAGHIGRETSEPRQGVSGAIRDSGTLYRLRIIGKPARDMLVSIRDDCTPQTIARIDSALSLAARR